MRPCLECGELFDPPHGNTKVCSNRCRNWRREQKRKRACSLCSAEMWHSRDGADEPLCRPCRSLLAAPKPSPVERWTCARCETACERPATRGQRPKYCERCQTRDWISRTRRFQIYERDGWVCWLCQEDVDAALIGSRSAWRPSLDHVTPRSLGGSDSNENLALAHQWCNAVRSDGRLYSPEVFRVGA